MTDKNISHFLKNPWVQCPQIPEVLNVLSTVTIPTYYRGSGQARSRLDLLEQQYRNWISDIVDLSEFGYCYIVNGVTDAINQWIATDRRPWQYYSGDYEYANMVSGHGVKVTELSDNHVLYISNPACATGNFVEIADIQVPVILDCAYIGSTRKQKIELPKNTEQIWFSFSKGWGLIGQRIGLVFTKDAHKSLGPMKAVEAWNYTSVEIALKIVETFDVDTVYNNYVDKQYKVCNEYSISPADCFFIANSTDDLYAKRRRVKDIARLDLSRLIENDS
jgi:hypothetical protein